MIFIKIWKQEILNYFSESVIFIFKNYIKSKSANFQEESSNFDSANALNKVILDLNWDVNVNSSNLKTDDSFKFMSQDSVLKLNAALKELSRSFPYRYVPILQALGECSFIPFPDEENVHNPGVNYYKAVVFQGAVARGLKFQTMSECQIAFLYASPTAIGLGYSGFGEEKIGFFKIGEFRVKPIAVKSNSKITITCTKGKTTKTVTGTNPKCPSGYKVKAWRANWLLSYQYFLFLYPRLWLRYEENFKTHCS